MSFDTAALETYAFARWESVIYDAMVLAAGIEYADRILRRPAQGWGRRISLRIPVHDVSRWSAADVSGALHSSVRFLTGDNWSIEFAPRTKAAWSPSQPLLSLSVKTEAVIPYSDGMDSRAVAGIVGAQLRDRLVRVRLGEKSWATPQNQREPFALVPYRVRNKVGRESSVRSRGFKFALIGGLAAHLTDAKCIVVPESGPGCIGPALVTVGHGYPDYRSHPRFTVLMERFLSALLGKDIRYDFPRIWCTKGETLREFVDIAGSDAWSSTRSCWRDSRWSSVDGSRRQCGVCAACMLRRVAVHAAGLAEPADTYVCTDMTAAHLEDAVDRRFERLSRRYREYAIAGVRHMSDLAAMAEQDSWAEVQRHAALIAPALGISGDEALTRLQRMLSKHAEEWHCYVRSLGPKSFVAQWGR